jgi:hypothetical protein
VIERLKNILNSEKMLFKFLYEIKLIDLGSLTILIDIKETEIKKHREYPHELTKIYVK